VHRRAEEINETTKQWVRHRGLKLVFDRAEVVKCDISATANTLKSQDTPNLLSPISNIRAVTLKLYTRAPSSREVSLAARQCQRLRSTKVSIRSRSSACSRLVSTERPHRNLTVPRNRGAFGLATRWWSTIRARRLLRCMSSRHSAGHAQASRGPHSEGTAKTITSCGSHHFEPPPRGV